MEYLIKEEDLKKLIKNVCINMAINDGGFEFSQKTALANFIIGKQPIEPLDKDRVYQLLDNYLFQQVKYYNQSFTGYSDLNCATMAEDKLKEVASEIVKEVSK